MTSKKKKETMRKYYQNNKEKLKIQSREYQQSPEGKLKRKEYNRKYREKTKMRKKAHKKVENAIKFGNLKRQPCEICGDPKSHAHHEDYEKLLEVRWLCDQHHKEAHKN
jgi:hypothetical protein